MITAEFIAERQQLYGKESWNYEGRFPVDLIASLPLVPLQYLEYKGALLDPNVPFQQPQDAVLQGAWAALSVPSSRDVFLHGLIAMRRHGNEEHWQARAAELLIPFMNAELAEKMLGAAFEPKVNESAIILGKVVLRMQELPDIVYSQDQKMQACIDWVEAIDPRSFVNEADTVTGVMRHMMRLLKDVQIPKRTVLAQAVLEKVQQLTIHSPSMMKESYHGEEYLECVSAALVYGADTKKLHNSVQLYNTLADAQKGQSGAIRLVDILKGWDLEEEDKNNKRNALLRSLFTLSDGKIYSGSYDDKFVTAVDRLVAEKNGTWDARTIYALVEWAVKAYDADSQRDVYTKVLPSLRPVFRPVDVGEYRKLRYGLEKQNEREQLDVFMVHAQAPWLKALGERSVPLWLDMLILDKGSAKVMRTLLGSKFMDEKAFMKILIDQGYETWITGAKLETSAFYEASREAEEAVFLRIVEDADRAMQSPVGKMLPREVADLLSYRSANILLRETVSSSIRDFAARHLVRIDVPDSMRNSMDGFLADIALDPTVLKQALSVRGAAQLRNVLAQYTEHMVVSQDPENVYEALNKGFFGDGILAYTNALSCLFRIPVTQRQGEHIGKIEQLISSWFVLLSVPRDIAEDKIAGTVGYSVLNVVSRLSNDPYWFSQIQARPNLRNHMPVPLLKKIISAAQKSR